MLLFLPPSWYLPGFDLYKRIARFLPRFCWRHLRLVEAGSKCGSCMAEAYCENVVKDTNEKFNG